MNNLFPDLESSQPPIQIRGLRKSFGDHEVLKGIDLTVKQGEVVCVIGPSGSASPLCCAASTCWSSRPAAPSNCSARR